MPKIIVRYIDLFNSYINFNHWHHWPFTLYKQNALHMFIISAACHKHFGQPDYES